MNKKLLLPLTLGLCAALFTACGDDNGANPGETPNSSASVDNPNSSADVLGPASSADVPPTSSADVPPASSADALPASSAAVVNPNVTYSYYGAELTGRDQFTYGRFEARMKMVSIPGSVSSMFLYYDPSYLLKDEPWNEIDIEVLGKDGSSWQSNLITREPDVDKKNPQLTSESVLPFGFDATEDFHLYAMIWTPEYIAWEIDSVEVRRDVVGTPHPKNANHDQVAFMTEQQSLRFNLWASKSVAWVGKFTGEELADGPQIQWIDYVRVYKYDAATKTFTMDWQDDFDGDDIDRTRWSAGNWEMEKVTLLRDNVVVEDGYCKLLMTREAD